MPNSGLFSVKRSSLIYLLSKSASSDFRVKPASKRSLKAVISESIADGHRRILLYDLNTIGTTF